ncbi:DUF4402 domain-containing protein [Deltaproteobacteria bacterium TL4]
MKKLIVLFASLMFLPSLFAAEETFQMSMKVYQPLAIGKVSDLVFPLIEVSSAAQPVTVTPDQGASFKITGQTGAGITASVTSSGLSNGTQTISIDSFSFGSPLDSAGRGTLASGGITATVGAALTVPANASTGEYAGTATFTVLYQ